MIGAGRSLWKLSGPTHCSYSSMPGIISNRLITEKAYKDALVHFQAKILPCFPLSKQNINLFLYTDTQRYTKPPKQKKYKRTPCRTEKAQEKKGNMLTNYLNSLFQMRTRYVYYR